ncbi:protein kinase [Nocardioides sp. CFH 31398]|uniref:serine/threonine-protein kinase n=1 Tax=Nocardioides sp. CFH 31398 TaxID=2919579 RepID=UPI001F05D508|nr:protein kinase [Nocardioides sp. CFH 31398]MCH1867839.1 protein kinase [Nocardioides sp. CFH 31398]
MAQPRVGEMVGRYRLDGVLGSGGMGTVMTATDTSLRREVAIKVMSPALAADPAFRARFDREATALARLESPHVIDVFDHGEHPPGPGGAPYLVTRLVRGGDLDSLLRARGPLPLRMAADVCAQVAEALRDAHAAGVVHRDVKPANVLLRDPDERRLFAVLCDFGIATVTASTQGSAHPAAPLTRTGGVSGTWGYMAPERIDGGPGTPASDLYALGCLLWASLTGRPPYTGGEYAVADAHHRAPVPQLGGDDPLARAVDRLLLALMAKHPQQRPASAEAVRAALADVAEGRVPGGGPVTSTGGAVGTGGTGGRRRGRVLLATAAAVVLVGGLATGVALWPRDDDPSGGRAGEAGETRGVDGSGGTAGGEAAPDPGADLNDDGLGDLLLQIGRSSDAQRFTFVSDGSAFLGPEVTAGTRGVPLRGDVDGDGLPDLVVVSRGDDVSQRISVELGTGETVDSTAPPIALQQLYTVVRDVDGDGLDDLSFWGTDTSGRLVFQTGPSLGDGEFGPREPVGLPDLTGGYLQPGDFDGDGRVDLAFVQQDAGRTGTVQVLLRTDDGFEAVGDPRPSLGPRDLVLTRTGDVDGDDADELVQVATTQGRRDVRVWQVEDGEVSDGAWFSGDVPPEAEIQLTPALSDVDGDGDDDLVLWRLTGEPGTVALDVALSTGSSYDAAEQWATWDCRPVCNNPLTVVSPTV